MIINPYVYTSTALLLDTYPNATAAYSIRKLRTAYTGFCLTARRTVGVTTVTANVSFDTNNTISLDSAIVIATGSSAATNLGQFCAATGYSNPDGIAANQSIYVSQWYDQTANANNMTQATASFQPRLINAGAMEILPMSSTNRVTLNTTWASPPVYLFRATNFTGRTFFTVAKIQISNAINLVLGASSPQNLMFYDGSNTGYNGIGIFDGTNIRSLSGGSFNTQLAYTNIRGGNIYGASNGNAESLIGSTAISSLAVRGLFHHGTGSGAITLRGPGSEMIIFTNDESANLNAIRTNINSYYGIY